MESLEGEKKAAADKVEALEQEIKQLKEAKPEAEAEAAKGEWWVSVSMIPTWHWRTDFAFLFLSFALSPLLCMYVMDVCMGYDNDTRICMHEDTFEVHYPSRSWYT